MATRDLNGVIDDKPVYVVQWPATKALENLSKALDTFGAKLAPFVEGNYLLGDIIALINSDPKKSVTLIKEFVAAARIDGKEVLIPTFDKHYNGELMLVFKVFAFVCEVQYKDFFEQGQSLQDRGQEEN